MFRRLILPLLLLLVVVGGILGYAMRPEISKFMADWSAPGGASTDAGEAGDLGVDEAGTSGRRERPRVVPLSVDDDLTAEAPLTETIVLAQALRHQEARQTLTSLEVLEKSETALRDAGAISEMEFRAFRIEHLLTSLWLAPAEERAQITEELRTLGDQIARGQDALRDAGMVTPTEALEARVATQDLAGIAGWIAAPIAGRDSAHAATRAQSLDPLATIVMKALSRRAADFRWLGGLRRDAAVKRTPVIARLLARPERLSLGDRTILRIERVLLNARLRQIEGTYARTSALQIATASRGDLEPTERAAVDGLVALIRWETSSVRAALPMR